MQLFLSQMERLPAVWLPFFVALAIAVSFIWKISERLHKSRDDAHLAKEQLSDRRIEMLEEQVKQHERKIASPQVSGPELSTVLPHSDKMPEIGSLELRAILPKSVTPATIFAEMSGATSMEAQRRLEPYKGKWMRCAGIITDVLEPRSDGAITVYVRSESMGEPPIPRYVTSDVIATFDSLPTTLEVARKLDEIQLIGQIGRSLIGCLSLDHCELET